MVQRITLASSEYAALLPNSVLELNAQHAHYLVRVLRLRSGDRFIVQNGQGAQWLAVLNEDLSSAQVIDAVVQESPVVLSAPIRLITALPKGNGFDQVVRQATELGVSHIYPVISDRTLLKPSSRKLERWRRIAEEASEQSERGTVPTVFEPTGFKNCLEQVEEEPLRYLCAARDDSYGLATESEEATKNNSFHRRKHLLVHLIDSDRAKRTASAALERPLGITLAVGPEGGWSPEEITVARLRGYEVVSLGPVILRAVTAPITALSLITAARELLI